MEPCGERMWVLSLVGTMDAVVRERLKTLAVGRNGECEAGFMSGRPGMTDDLQQWNNPCSIDRLSPLHPRFLTGVGLLPG